MGVEGKKSCLFRKLMMSQYHSEQPLALTGEECQQIDRMTAWIANAVAQAIEHQSYVSQNVLNYTMARVTAMVMKLNFDMFGGEHELEHQLYLIEQEWIMVKGKEINYGSTPGTDT